MPEDVYLHGPHWMVHSEVMMDSIKQLMSHTGWRQLEMWQMAK